MPQYFLAGFRGETPQVFLQLLLQFLQEKIGKQQDVFTPVAQGRKGNSHDVQPVVEIFAKLPPIDLFLQLGIGGGDDADVHPDILHAADFSEGRFLNQPQELGLQVDRQVAYFVEEEGPAVGHFDQSLLVAAGVGERAFFMAEKFRLHQIGRKRCAIDLDEHAVPGRLS